MSAFQKSLFVCLILSLCSFSFAGNLVGHWKLDETSGTTAYDSAGANDGTVSGALWTAGTIDGGLDFDGIDDKVIIPDSDVLTPANTMTLSFWVYNRGEQPVGIYKWASCPSESASPGNSRAYNLAITMESKVSFSVLSSASNGDTLISIGTVPLNQWHLITVTFDSGQAKIYIDGMLDSSKTMTVTSIMNDKQPLTFGGAWDYCGTDEWLARLNGVFDDIRLYDYALSDAEVATLYGQAPQSGLVGHWKLDEMSGTTAYDSAGTYNGTLVGSPLPVWTNGMIGGALSFSGAQGICISDSSGSASPLNIYNSNITLAAWIKPAATGGGTIISRAKEHYIAYRIYSPDGKKVTLNTYRSPTHWLLTTGDVLTPGNWYHVVGVFDRDSDTGIIYVNGVEQARSTSMTTDPYSCDAPTTIGYRNNTSDQPYNGVIDDACIYDYALSDAEVAALYNQSPLPHVATTYHVATTGLDINAGTTQATAFATIQKGIDIAVDGDTVVVWPGTYDQQTNFNGKAIMVKSADAEPAVISNSSGYAFVFENAEEANSVLQNFIIAKGCFAVYASGSSPTIKNLTIADNYFGIDAYDDATPAVSNCIFLNNRFGDIEGADTQYSWLIDQIAPISYWKFEETTGTVAYDEVGNNDGAITGATREPNGLLGRALTFNGTSNYVEIPDNASLNIAGNITIAAWVKSNALGNDNKLHTIVSRYAGPRLYYDGITSGGIGFVFDLGLRWPSTIAISSEPLIPGQWYFVAGVYDGTNIKIYVNAVEKKSVLALSKPSLAGRGNVYIGRDYGGGNYFDGQIDEVALFDRALNTKEIENYYKNTQAGYDYIDPMMVDSDGGDYHLFSEFGRYDLTTNSWVLDDATSPCVDAGDPADNPMGEPMPNGGRINIGAYGGIGHASKGGEWPLPFDFNTDGIVNMADFAKLAEHWLDKLPWVE